MRACRIAVVMLCVVAGAAKSQVPMVADAGGPSSGPRFLLAKASGRGEASTVPIDVERSPVLVRRLTLDLNGTRKEALSVIAAMAGLQLLYGSEVMLLNERVRLKAEGITVAAALTDVLVGAQVDVVFDGRGGATITKRRGAEAMPLVGTITGQVTEAATGNAVPQAQVSVQGTSLGRATDEDGQYTITGVTAGQRTVTVRRLGYDPMSREIEVRDGESATADFALVGATTRLAEIVTTVTGGQRRVEMGNAVGRVGADSLTRIAPVMSLGDLLQGRVPGLLSIQSGGSAGMSGRLRIRGLSSALVPNDPIVVIDGIRVEATAGDQIGSASSLPTTHQSGGGTGRLSDIDPDEIASIEVVMGPSAATLYGTDAANGVLVITTKRGQAGRARITATIEGGVVSERLDQEALYPDAYYAFGRNTTTNAQQRCTNLLRAAGSCVVDSVRSFNTYRDRATRPFKNAPVRQIGVQASGGSSGGTTYFLSGHYAHETGTVFMPEVDQAFIRRTEGREVPNWQVRPNAYDRLNFRANVSTPLGRKGSATVSTGFISNETRTVSNLSRIQVGYRDANDGWAVGSRPAHQLAFRNDDMVRRFIGSIGSSYAAADWLALRGTIGADLSTNSYGRLMRRGEGGPSSGFVTGLRTLNELAVARYSLDVGATATRSLSPSVTSKTSVGVQYNRRGQRGTTVSVTNLPLGGETIAGGTVRVSASTPAEATLITAVAGAYVEEVVGLRDRLFVTGAMRFDGGSAFGQDFSVAAYPKASISWVVADDAAGRVGPLARGLVNALRLRAAYGASGVQPGPTDALSRVIVASGLAVSGATSAPGAALLAGNPNLKPERTSEVEVGFDLETWQRRVQLEATAYHRTSKDALVSRPLGLDVAPVAGAAVVENLGAVRNRGFDLLLSAELLRRSTVAAGFTSTFALNDNKLLELGEGVLASAPSSQAARLEEGYPIFGMWAMTIESYADADGDGVIELSEVVAGPAVSKFFGSLFPKREATVAPYLKLFGHRLHISSLLQYRGDFYRANLSRSSACSASPAAAGARCANDPTTSLADQANAISLTLARQGPIVQDASYLLLREQSVSLNLPASITRRLRADAASLVFAGRNVALLWKASSALPFEAANETPDAERLTGRMAPVTYWLARLHLTF